MAEKAEKQFSLGEVYELICRVTEILARRGFRAPVEMRLSERLFDAGMEHMTGIVGQITGGLQEEGYEPCLKQEELAEITIECARILVRVDASWVCKHKHLERMRGMVLEMLGTMGYVLHPHHRTGAIEWYQHPNWPLLAHEAGLSENEIERLQNKGGTTDGAH